jgi:pyruvate dehydrogenase E2 component (dihydrolipoamide acetyltransferase)
MGMTEGKVVTWHHAVGDRVVADQPLVEVEAEKTTDDVLAPVTGTLLKVLVEVGEAVPVRTVLALIGEPDEAAGDGPEPTAAPPAPTVAPPADRAGGTNVHATPVARRVAKEHGIDLATVEGTGPRGRITEEDVRRAIEAPPAAASVPATSQRLDGIRGAIAKRMHASLQTMAQLTLTRQIDVTELVRLQPRLKEQSGISLTDLLLKGVATALVRHPRLNATLEDDVVTIHPAVHVGLAVSLDDGLIVPVLRDAQEKSLAQISAEARQLAEKARTNTAKPSEVSGSTFTVTNLGAYGIDAFTPIVNPPEVAILGVGRANEVLVRQGNDLSWRTVITFSLTIDHRAVDGAPGAQFLQTLADILAEPSRLADGQET